MSKLLLVTFFSTLAAAQTTPNIVSPSTKMEHPEIPPGEAQISADTMIVVSAYDEEIHSYLIALASNGAIGPLYADLDSLALSIPAINIDRVRKDPKSIVTNFYHTDKPIRLLNDAVVDKRRAPASKD